VPDFRHESNLRHDQCGFETQRHFQPKLCLLIKVYCLLSNCGQFAHFEVFNRDGKLVSVGAIQLHFKVSVTQPSDAVKRRNGKTDRGTSTCPFELVSSLSYLFGWWMDDVYSLIHSKGENCRIKGLIASRARGVKFQ
jgi:hypothetical protein